MPKPTAHHKRGKPANRSKRRGSPRSLPSVVVVGFGRTGGALARGLWRAGWPVRIFPRSGESTRRAAALNLPIADHDALRQAHLCGHAVPHDTVPLAAKMLQRAVALVISLEHSPGAMNLAACRYAAPILES